MKRYLGPLSAFVLLAIPSAAAGTTPPSSNQDDIPAFLGRGYTYCDAKLLSSLWRAPIAESKARAGEWIRNGNERPLEDAFNDAHEQAARDPSKGCTFVEAGLANADADALAKIWNQSPADARAMAERKLAAAGGETFLKKLVRGSAPAAREGQKVRNTSGAADHVTYCDAKLLAAHWNAPVADAKARIEAMTKRDRSAVDRALGEARASAQQNADRVSCAFHETAFHHADAVALARLWKTSPADAKAFVGRSVAAGNEDALRAALARAPR